MCTLLGIVALLAAWTMTIVQRQLYPYLVSTSIDAATGEKDALAVAAGTGATSKSGMTGLQVIVTAAGVGGACANATWTAAGLRSGAFSRTSVTSCNNVAQHVFKCPDCVFQAGSRLDLQLHWSCQSLLVEAFSVGHTGAVTSWSTTATSQVVPVLSPDATDAEVQLLSSVLWEVPPMLLLMTDKTRPNNPQTRGACREKLGSA